MSTEMSVTLEAGPQRREEAGRKLQMETRAKVGALLFGLGISLGMAEIFIRIFVPDTTFASKIRLAFLRETPSSAIRTSRTSMATHKDLFMSKRTALGTEGGNY